jgi:ABC-type transporter Mla subunit MlaD
MPARKKSRSTGGGRNFKALAARLTAASKALGKAHKAHADSVARAMRDLRRADDALARAVETAQKVFDAVAASSPGTYPNNTEVPPK